MKIFQVWKVRETALVILALAVSFVFARVVAAQGDRVFVDMRQPGKIDLVVGKSAVLKSSGPIDRISIAAPKIADFVMLSSQEIYLTGKTPGMTNLTLWQGTRIAAIYDLEVNYDISRLKQKLHDVLPAEEEIRVISSHHSITLSGRVSSTANLSQALAVAKAFAPEGKVSNLLEVAGIHQVMLEVRVAEIDQSLTKRLGFNFTYARGEDFVVGLLGNLSSLSNNVPSGGAFGIDVSDPVNLLFRFRSGSATWTGLIDALNEDGLLKVLAEPTLIALSGQSARFLAGGEFPIPVPQGLGTVGIQYKEFGVALAFTPTVLEEDRISIDVTPSVSELDFTTSLVIEGYAVPGLSTRTASTMVELADGQSFAIAGLLSDTVRDSVRKYPLLGDLPVLGALFRSREFQKGERELIIIVTPHLVKPLDLSKQTLPTDYYFEPNAWEFYGLGLMEARDATTPAPIMSGEFEGEFGHAIPLPD